MNKFWGNIEGHQQIRIVEKYIESPEATSLKSLNLSGNCYILDSGAKKICTALTSSLYCNLISLDLSDTGIRMKSIIVLSKYLISPSSSCLEDLDISYNEIGEIGGEQICLALTASKRCKLKSLGLARTEIGRNTIRILGKYLTSKRSSRLSNLDLGGNEKIGDKGAQILCSALFLHPTVSHLDLEKCRIGDRSASPLQYLISNYNTSLAYINLDGNSALSEQLSDHICDIVKSNKNYKQLCSVMESCVNNPHSNNTAIEESSLSELQFQKIRKCVKKVLDISPQWRYNKRSYSIMENNHDQIIRSLVSQLSSTEQTTRRMLSLPLHILKWRILFLRSILYSYHLK